METFKQLDTISFLAIFAILNFKLSKFQIINIETFSKIYYTVTKTGITLLIVKEN